MIRRLFEFCLPLAMLVCAGMLAHRTEAAVIFYSTRPAFDLAAPGLPIEDFEEAPSGLFTGFESPLDSSSSNSAFSPGEILSGITFSTDPVTGANNDFGTMDGSIEAGVPSLIVIAQAGNSVGSLIDMAFSPDITALGLDVFINFANPDAADITIELFNGATSLHTETLNGVDMTGAFAGFTSDTPITRATVRGFDGSNPRIEGVDNVAFGSTSATTPEPAALGLAAVAFVFLYLMVPRSRTTTRQR